MPILSRNELVPAANATVNVKALAEYQRLRQRIPVEREKFYKVYRQTLLVANQYFDTHELRDTVVRLRREIRMATKGIPTSHVENATAAGFISNGTEQLYNAQLHLCKAAYRMVAPLVHPDRSKYGRELFQQVRTAYALRDLTFLQETYIALVHEKDLHWVTTKGIEYCKQEIERPKVSLGLLQSTPEFKIARAHIQRNFDSAQRAANARMTELVVVLNAELNYLLTGSLPGAVNDSTEEVGSSQSDETGSSSSTDKESKASGRIEADSAGESTTGESGDEDRYH